MKKQTVIPVLAALVACSLVASPAAHAGEGNAWPSVPAHELAARRGGLRIGGLDVSVDFRVRASIDGIEPASAPRVLEINDFGGLSVLAELLNRLDGVHIEREAEIRVRIDGFSSVFGSPALRIARARLRATFE